jgi:hypothetical protein
MNQTAMAGAQGVDLCCAPIVSHEESQGSASDVASMSQESGHAKMYLTPASN